jgi:hypothetical protein
MRASYVPDPAATAGLERLAVTAPTAGGGELTLYLKGGRRVRGALTAGQVRDVLRRWAAAARDGKGELVVGEEPPPRRTGRASPAPHPPTPPPAPLPRGGGRAERPVRGPLSPRPAPPGATAAGPAPGAAAPTTSTTWPGAAPSATPPRGSG